MNKILIKLAYWLEKIAWRILARSSNRYIYGIAGEDLKPGEFVTLKDGKMFKCRDTHSQDPYQLK